MSKVVTLPSGATVKLRDPATLLIKDRNKVLKTAGNEEGAMQAIALIDGLLSVMIVEWSFDLIPPAIRIASLEEMTPTDYNFLVEETKSAQDYLFPNMSEGSADDPKVNTANSND
jgi:hypothetical protein